jgi:PBP1b-binding outer membrane lipoprotein LpoB
MKKIFFVCSIALLLGACANDPKPTQQEQQKVEEQVAKDQVAQDSMEAVILQQIEASASDTTTKP